MNRTAPARPATTGIAFLLAAIAAPALAQGSEALDRLEAASEEMNRNFEAFYVSRVPALAGVMPDAEWDEAYRDMGRCLLRRMEEERGAEGVEEYLAAMEAYAAKPVETFSDMTSGQPRLLRDEVAIAVGQECGVIEIAMARMRDSGFLEAIGRPGVMERVMADPTPGTEDAVQVPVEAPVEAPTETDALGAESSGG